jgi:hypothetical protein
MDGIKEAPMAGSESQTASQKNTQGKEIGLLGRLKKAIFG